MKQKFEFTNETVAAEYERLGVEDLKDLAQAFINNFSVPITRFADSVGLSYHTVTLWLRNKYKMGDRSLKAIYDYISRASESWNNYYSAVKNGQNTQCQEV